jgi:hypothetical protein
MAEVKDKLVTVESVKMIHDSLNNKLEDVANAVNAIDFPVDSVNGKTGVVSLTASDVGAAPSSHNHTKSQISDFPSSMPASDVYAWAKASSKPSYSYSEVGAAPSSHNHSASNITSGTLPISRGGTGATGAANARTNLGFSMFTAHDLSSSSWVGVMKDNWSSLPDGNFIIYGRTGSVFCSVGIKAGNYGAALAFNYVDPELYLYRNNNGTWSEAAVIK